MSRMITGEVSDDTQYQRITSIAGGGGGGGRRGRGIIPA